VFDYNHRELAVDRYRTFDELTARLGEGFAPTAAYEDWRKLGVKGLRHKVVDFLCEVQYLAEERLTLAEILQPRGRDWSRPNNREFNRSRWKVIWNGHDLVLKILHCLDFLRKCREVSDWFGPAFHFIGNPLMIPFALANAFEGLQLKQQVDDQLDSQPYDRRGIAEVAMKGEWQQQQYLNEFRRRFILLTAERSFNWPLLPNIREEIVNVRLCTSFMVLFICCKESIEKSRQWELKFVTKISSLRGKWQYLIGEGNKKGDKLLPIPSLESRKPRAELVKRMLRKPTTILRKNHIVPDDLEDSFFSYGSSEEASEIVPSNTEAPEPPENRPFLLRAKQFNEMVKAAAPPKPVSLPKLQDDAARRRTTMRDRATLLKSGRKSTLSPMHHQSSIRDVSTNSSSLERGEEEDAAIGELDSPSSLEKRRKKTKKNSMRLPRVSSAGLLGERGSLMKAGMKRMTMTTPALGTVQEGVMQTDPLSSPVTPLQSSPPNSRQTVRITRLISSASVSEKRRSVVNKRGSTMMALESSPPTSSPTQIAEGSLPLLLENSLSLQSSDSRVSAPGNKGVRRSKIKTAASQDRLELAKESAASRRVSRLPAMKEGSPSKRLTKRRLTASTPPLAISAAAAASSPLKPAPSR
jgi:hypothetical protein